jgi:hypothetical protein
LTEISEAGAVIRKNLNEFLLHIKLVTDSTAATSDYFHVSPTNGHDSSTSEKQTSMTKTSTIITRRMINDDDIEEEDEDDEEGDGSNNDKQRSHDQSIDQILNASDRLFSSMGDASEMVKQAKALAQATAQLVSSLRQQAEMAVDDTDRQKKLLSAAKMLADATAKLVEAAKGCASQPNDTQLQHELKHAAEELSMSERYATDLC